MATDSAVRSVTNTLSGTTADTVTLTQCWPAVSITNHDATDTIYFRMDGTAAVAAADGTTVVLPASTVIAKSAITASGTTVVSIVGDGGTYTIEGVT